MQEDFGEVNGIPYQATSNSIAPDMGEIQLVVVFQFFTDPEFKSQREFFDNFFDYIALSDYCVCERDCCGHRYYYSPVVTRVNSTTWIMTQRGSRNY